MASYRAVIPYKFPSFNDYINECRKNKYAGNKKKHEIERSIKPYLKHLPQINRPVTIDFVWHEENRKRDPDNCAFAKKFILDAMVALGVLEDDSIKYVRGFTDRFDIGREAKVSIYIHEVS